MEVLLGVCCIFAITFAFGFLGQKTAERDVREALKVDGLTPVTAKLNMRKGTKSLTHVDFTATDSAGREVAGYGTRVQGVITLTYEKPE